ncbi:hypothetical protein E1A91_D09G091200v1 [Gossypium mustelinum]|uniref:beta-ketoacyl-[acyl-carrier-protein] synthase I n=1 Tax=Gossypium mustelinum TaxID=34275 RepID=A0A5D2TH67_GOSMU|nr:hypothetical protein E1A91_D09G091200v1 [Gossypium mustelinum]
MAAASSLSSLLVSSMALTSPIFQSHCLNNTTCKRGTTMAVSLQTANKPVIHHEKPANKQRRVVVTGIGLVTALGEDPDVFYNNVLQGISGITEIEKFDTSQLPSKIGAELKSFSPEGFVSSKLAMRADNFMLYLITAGKKALADGGISDEVNGQLDKTRCGIIVGSAMGGLRGWMGPNYIINAGCATSNHCILSAAGHITDGITDMMLCGGSDAGVHPIGLAGFASCKALSKRDCDPTKASCPWDTNRDGIVLGDGAGVLLLEELEHAKRRGARIYAEFLGGSSSADAYHLTRPHPDGIVGCIEKALAKAGVAREDVNYINAHAPSTQVGDLIEFAALVRCFGNNMELRINSTKSMTGHLAGATGAVDAIATIKAIQTGWVHPNINLDNPDKAVDMNLLVGSKKERLNIKVALSNSFTLGGQNSSILFAPLHSE